MPASGALSSGVEGDAEAVADEVDSEHGDHDGAAGEVDTHQARQR